MQSDRKLTSEMTPPPPSRRGGGERGGSKAGGRGRGRGGGGRGGRGGAAASTAGAEPPSAAQAPPASADSSTRNAKAKGDKPKPPHAKPGSGTRGGRGAGAPSGRPARAAVSLIMRKVLVRQLPHDWDEGKLLELLETHGVTKQHVWRFLPGKVRANNRPPRPGRVYLDFKKDSDVANSVIDKLHGLVVADSKDQQTKLEAAFAPFQKVPREKQRKDAKVGTLDRDADFLAFLEALSKPKEKLPSADLVADAKDTEPAEKPVAALVLYLNERKRDKKGKFGGKSTDKARGARAKSAKETRGAKEKTKGSKTKGSKASEATAGKEGAKVRKTRGKTAPPPKEKTGDSDSLAPGTLKIMTAKARDSAAPPPAMEKAGSELSAAGSSKPKQGKREGSSKPARRGGQQSQKETTGDAPSADAASAAPAKDKTAGGRGRRDSRANKGPKSAGGRGDQPKKVFAPKATTPAG